MKEIKEVDINTIPDWEREMVKRLSERNVWDNDSNAAYATKVYVYHIPSKRLYVGAGNVSYLNFFRTEDGVKIEDRGIGSKWFYIKI